MTDLLTKIGALLCIGVAVGLLGAINYLLYQKDGKQ